jgi:hypothetical protein
MWFTNKSRQEVEEEYDTIRKNSDVPTSTDLQVNFDCGDIGDVSSIFSELDDLEITIERKPFRLMTTLCQGLYERSNLLITDEQNNLLPTGNDKGYPNRIFKIARNVGGAYFDDNLFQFHKVDLRANKIDNAKEFITFFNLRDIPKQDNIVMVFPVYCKRGGTRGLKEGDVLDTYILHPRLLDKIQVKVGTKEDERRVFKNRTLTRPEIDGQFIQAQLLLDKPIDETQFFEIKLSHVNLGDIMEYSIAGKQVLGKKQSIDKVQKLHKSFPLTNSYLNFKVYDYMKQNINQTMIQNIKRQ